MNNEIDIKSVFGIIRRQFWFIVSVLIGVTALGVVLAYSLTPKYAATSLVFVDSSPQNLLDPQARLTGGVTDNGRIESEVNILGSDAILLDVVRSQNLIADNEFGVKLGLLDRVLAYFQLRSPTPVTGEVALGRVLRSFKNAVVVGRNGLTYLISVTVTSRNPEKAARLANAVTDAYIRQQLDSKVASISAARNRLQLRVESASAAIAESEKNFDTYLSQNMKRLEGQAGGNVAALRQRLDEIERNRVSALARVNAANQSLREGNLDQVVAQLGSDALAELDRQRAEIARNIAADTADSQQVTDLRAQLEALDNQIRQQAPQQIADLKQTVTQQADDEANKIREQLRSAILNSDLPPEVLTEIFAIQQSSDIKRRQYQTLLSRLQDLEAQIDLQLADSRIVSSALVPSAPSSPNRSLIIAISGFLALLSGFGLAVVREHFIGGFVDEGQLESVLRAPLASISPRYSGPDDPDALSIADGMVKAPLSMYAESIRRLRASIEHTQSDTGRVIMISSAIPGEGKSTMALALARMYALSGKKTLLIDCDLRKPTMHKHVGLQPNAGFIDFLRRHDADNNGSLPKVLVNDPLSDLILMLGGRSSDIGTDEFFMDERLGRVLATARKHFDYIILDTPPIDPVVDGLYLARNADVVFFVVKWATTSQTVAKRSLEALKDNISGNTQIYTVLNQQDLASFSKSNAYSEYYNS
ncbi:GumC family protein [Rhizobium sp. SG2393]|uniref:GumC family protein n=1 Tax=Rhizobium sp. SG2393 TaxID=3276279 RepID=UPI00366D6A41